jgi:hypothetical protein
MSPIEVRVAATTGDLPFEDVLGIYASVGWTAYTRDPKRIRAALAERYAHVRQHALLTDDEPGQRAFYEGLGYAETRDHGDGSLRAFVRFV